MNLFFFLFACGGADQAVKVFNPAPEARITSPPAGDSIIENTTVMLRGTATDGNHGPEELLVIWRSTARELCPSTVPNSDGTTTCEVQLALEEEQITLEVFDPENSAGSDTIEVEVMPGNPPTATITSPIPTGKYYSNVEVEFTALLDTTTGDKDNLVARWESNIDGSLPMMENPDTDGNYFDRSFLTENNHRITLTVSDPQGNETIDTVDITIGPENQIPDCEITAPADGSISAFGDLVFFEGTASDLDVPTNQLTYTWTSSIENDQSDSDPDNDYLSQGTPSAAGEIIYGADQLGGGIHTITLTVTDEAGGMCTDFILHTVSVPPTIEIVTPANNDVFDSSETISFAALVSDFEDAGPLLKVEWHSNVDGVFGPDNDNDGVVDPIPADSAGNALLNWDNLSPGNHLITATVTDNDNLTATAVTAIEVKDCGQIFWYLDADNDGFGDTGTLYPGCNPPGGYIEISGDCDDGDPSQNPDANESCNGEDDNCDGTIDENSAIDVKSWYEDTDGDGYGASSTLVISCDAPNNTYVEAPGDCDDNNLNVNPDALEVCEDGLDNDCVDGDESCQIEIPIANADSIMYGPTAQDFAGFAVANFGDIDGDGDNDFGIGAYGDDSSGVNAAGVVYILTSPVNSGSLNLPTVATARIWGEFVLDSVGYAIAPAGDIDNDGLADIMVGAYQEDSGGSNAGSTYIFLGNQLSGDLYLSDAYLQFVGEGADNYSGSAMDGNGDFNGDGIPDFAIGAYGEDSIANDQGKAYVFLGTGSLTGSYPLGFANYAFTGVSYDDFAGWDLTFVGDTDGDGKDDLLIGAYGEDSNGNASGAAYLIRDNGTQGTTSLQFADATFRGEGSDHFAGQRVASAGDFNEDGYADLFIGAPGENSNGTSTGAAYVIFTDPNTSGMMDLSAADMKFIGEASLHYAGRGLANANDLDGDGHQDLLIGAPGATSGSDAVGAAYMALGPAQSGIYEMNLHNTYARAIGESVGNYTGWDICSLGDLDNDGRSESLIGAYKESSSGTNAGAVYLMLGSQW